MDRTGIIILAAGDSSRLGRPKQTLFYNGKGLLQHVADASKEAGLDPVIIITGAFSDDVTERLDTTGVSVLHNEHWKQGMATSIALGIDSLPADDSVSSVIISVCDQPLLTAATFKRLMDARKHTGKGIIASAYAETVGVPVLYDKKYFNGLKEPETGEGAKRLIHLHKEDVAQVDFQAGSIDIDTEEDYNLLLDSSSEHSLQ